MGKLGVGVSKTTLTLVERDDYRRVLKRNVECDTHLYYSRHGKYATENEELEKAYMEKQKKSFTIKQHEDKTLHRVNRQLGEQVELRHVGVAPKLKLHLDDEQGRLDKNFRRDANLKHSEVVKQEIEKPELPAFELQHAEIQKSEIKKAKLEFPELKYVPFAELEEREKIERGKVKYRAEMEPWVVGHIKDVNVKEGHPAKFMVEYRGNPIPEVTWFKEELEIESSTQFQIMACDTHSYLFIPEVFTDDNGTYYAHVSNKMGEVRSKGLLQVEEEKQQAVPPKFDVRLIDKDIRIGEHIGELRVQVSGVPRPGIKWFKDGEPIEVDNKHYREVQDKNCYNLQLWNTTIDDKGVYECVAENKCGRTRCHCTIKMVEPVEDKPTDPKPVLKSNPNDEKVREGEKITLTAVFEDLPEPPKATWYHNNQIIKKSKYFDIRRKGCVFTLTIVEAFVEDEGEYRCVVKNGGGEAEAKCQLFIEAPPPRILTDLVDQTILEGSDFTMEIKAIGEIAEYAWFKDGIIVKPCEEFQMGKDTEKIWLKVKSALLQDAGAYSVSISNGVDIMESSCKVIIEPKQELIQRKPQLTKKLQGIVKVVEGSTIKLEVELLKNDSTTCTWFKSGVPIEHSDKFQVWHAGALQEPVQSVLIIMNLTLDDAAEYTFRASNDLGECATSATVIVQRQEVVPDVKPETIKPQIFGKILPATANEKIHDEISLEAHFQGTPVPQTTWSFKGTPLLQNVKYNITNTKTTSKLTIREPVPEDEGDYQFAITSEFGASEITGKLTVIPAPPPPAPPAAKDKSGRPKIKRGTVPSMEYMLEWSSFEEEDEPVPVEKVIYKSPPDDFVPVVDGELVFPTPPKERTLKKAT